MNKKWGLMQNKIALKWKKQKSENLRKNQKRKQQTSLTGIRTKYKKQSSKYLIWYPDKR